MISRVALTTMVSSLGSEPIGSSSVIGDTRWAGDYGVNADYIAVTHCSAEFIPLEEILVLATYFVNTRWVFCVDH